MVSEAALYLNYFSSCASRMHMGHVLMCCRKKSQLLPSTEQVFFQCTYYSVQQMHLCADGHVNDPKTVKAQFFGKKELQSFLNLLQPSAYIADTKVVLVRVL